MVIDVLRTIAGWPAAAAPSRSLRRQLRRPVVTVPAPAPVGGAVPVPVVVTVVPVPAGAVIAASLIPAVSRSRSAIAVNTAASSLPVPGFQTS